VVADLNARANQLSPVVQIGFNANLPALVVAQILYGDATREPDLTARNDPVNPGFLPLSIEALTQ
jgi:prophage DNA circulation protein